MTDEKVREFHKSKMLWAVIIVSGLVLWYANRASDSDAGRGRTTSAPARPTNALTVTLDEERWTDWINIPVGHRFVVDAPEAELLELWFWDGRRRLLRKGDSVWFGKLNDCTFRLRGTPGKATVTIQ